MTSEAFLHTDGARVVDGRGTTVVLRGVGLGGWLNMENFITGYPATETLMREAVAGVLGAERAARFFDRLLSSFFAEPDAEFLAALGFNSVRLPVNYRHLESDDRPLQTIEAGFDRIDRAIELCAARGIYTVIDLHALPGGQNQHWHSDNPTHVAEVMEPLHAFVAKEFPQWRAYPWNARRSTNDIVRHILFAQALLDEYAQRFRGLTDDELVALADSFAFVRCVKRTRLCGLLRAHAKHAVVLPHDGDAMA